MFYRNPNLAFRLLGVFYVERPAMQHNEQNRRHVALSYRLKGDAIYEIGGQRLHAQTGSIVYLPAGVDYRIQSGEETLLVVHLESFGNEETSIQILDHAEEMEPLFRNLLAIWETGDPSAYNRAMSVLYTLFETLRQREEPDSAAIPPVIVPGVRRLRAEFRNPKLTVAQLAELCFISEVYFRRIYRERFGESPMQTLLSFRFAYACNLLRSGYYTPTQTAQLSGFSDVKYFRTAFTRRFGLSPTEYSRTHGDA